MKKITYLTLVVSVAVLFSCKKESPGTRPLASLNLVNAVVGLSSLQVNFNNAEGFDYYSYISNSGVTVYFGSNNVYSVIAGRNVPMAVINASDTTTTLFNTTLNLVNGGVYSLYLAGQLGSIDTVMVKDQIPNYTDSVTGLRFINLSQGSLPVNVTMAATPGTNEFANVVYKQISGFNSYPAGAANSSYTFNVYQASSDSLLASYSFTPVPFQSSTLALIGQETGPNAGLEIMQINNR